MRHELKMWPDPFKAVSSGEKTWEHRCDDRGFQRGDEVVLMEWNPETLTYTGAELQFKVGYILRGPSYGIAKGFCVFTLIPS